MVCMLFHVSASYNNVVQICDVKVKAAQYGIHDLLKNSGCDLDPKRKSFVSVKTSMGVDTEKNSAVIVDWDLHVSVASSGLGSG